MLELPIHRSVRFALVSPHYPENLGATCRAMKTMGFMNLGIVRPSRLATPDHPMAQKMAVKSWDVLDNTQIYDNVAEAVVGAELVVGSTARRGVSVVSPRELAKVALKIAAEHKKTVVLFGNEKNGLTAEELRHCDLVVRAPIAADQPSLNLAQAVQIVAYELFVAALAEKPTS